MADSLNICVVDDDRDVAEGLAEILELAGHQVQTAFSGQDALRILEQGDFDVAFLNAILPERNRLESFMELRNANPDMQAVMMTGYTIEQLLRQTVRDGSVSVLQRPVAMDEVLRALEAAKPQGIVLVAEDDPEIRHKISETLALQDYQVGVARTVGDALDMVFANECDILVLDLHRPVIDALEVYLELEKHERALPTIVISEAPDKESGPIDLLRDQGITGVLVKPFDPARLLAALSKRQRKTTAPVVEEPAVEIDPTTNGHRGRILVIDDDRDLAEGLAEVLRDLGHTVEIAFNGSDALETARRFDAQIALVDIKLGRVNGLELISSLKELRPGIVNVVITANAGKESVIAALRSGAFDFLNKPMHPQDLFVILDRCFEQISAQRSKSKTSAETPSEFVAHASHELRDPLNAVVGFSEILGDELMGPLGSDQYLYYAKGINEAGQHLTNVIDDMFESTEEGMQAPDTSEQQSQPADSAATPPADCAEPLAEVASGGSSIDLPDQGGQQPSDMDHGEPATDHPDAHMPEPEDALSGDPRYLEPTPSQTNSGRSPESVSPPFGEAPPLPYSDAVSGDDTSTLPSEVDPAGFEAAQRILEETDPLAPARTAADAAVVHSDQSRPPTAMSDLHRDEAKPFPPVSELSPGETAEAGSHMVPQPRAEPGPPDQVHTAPRHPAADWPEPSEARVATSEQRTLADPGHEVTQDLPDIEAVAGAPQAEHTEGAEPDFEREEERDSEPAPDNEEKKILRFSPFKKVI